MNGLKLAVALSANEGLNLERWPSGLRRTPGKGVHGKLCREFESRSLRQILSPGSPIVEPTQRVAVIEDFPDLPLFVYPMFLLPESS